MKNLIIITLIHFVYTSFLFAQNTRYIDEVFTEDEIVIEKDIYYSTNITFFDRDSLLHVSNPIEEDLHFDIYMPDVNIDSETNRPVVVVSPLGIYPKYVLNCFGGSKNDLMAVDMATKLAKMGYVSVVPQIRVGFDSLNIWGNIGFYQATITADLRRSIDTKNCVKYLRKDYEDWGNNYNIDPDRFVSWGGANHRGVFYTNESEFRDSQYFQPNMKGDLELAYDSTYFGGFEGLNDGFRDSTQTNIASPYPDQNGDFQMAVIMGELAYDTNFIHVNEIPTIFFDSKNNPVINIEFWALEGGADEYFINPVVFLPWVARRMDELGNNDIWKGIDFTNPIANERLIYPPDTTFGPIEGLYGVENGISNRLSWLYWDADACLAANLPIGEMELTNHPDMTIENGRLALNEMIQFFGPRACLALGLECGELFSNGNENQENQISFKVSPNPSLGIFNFESNIEHPMEYLQIFDLQGQLVFEKAIENENHMVVNLDLSNGIYFAKIQFKKGIGVQKLILNE